MKTDLTIQFSVPFQHLKDHLTFSLWESLTELVTSTSRYSSLTLPISDPRVEIIQKENKLVHGNSLIRMIRETINLEDSDINLLESYVLLPASQSDDEIALVGDKSSYYKIETECFECGRFKYEQCKNLRIAKSINAEFDETEYGDLIVSDRIKMAISNDGFIGLSFRRIDNTMDWWQLEADTTRRVHIPGSTIVEREICKACGKPRIVAFENTNRVSLFESSQPVPRIEKTPVLAVENAVGDLSKTAIEFGCIGRRNEGAPPITHHFRSSKPMWVISGRLGKRLFQLIKGGFRLLPARVVRSDFPYQ